MTGHVRRIATQLGYLSADDLGKPLEVGTVELGTLVEIRHHTEGGRPQVTVKTLQAERFRRETYPTDRAAVVTYGGGR